MKCVPVWETRPLQLHLCCSLLASEVSTAFFISCVLQVSGVLQVCGVLRVCGVLWVCDVLRGL